MAAWPWDDPQWLCKRRRVYVYYDSSVSMPDTPENQRDYAQPRTQKPGLGFPLARIAAVFSLPCGGAARPNSHEFGYRTDPADTA
jgi:hypothetical protein